MPSFRKADRYEGVVPVYSTPLGEQYAAVDRRASDDILRVRQEQIHTFGHTVAADLDKPLRFFAADLESRARAILEDVQFHKPADQVRRRLVKLGALALAMIDRIDAGEETSDR